MPPVGRSPCVRSLVERGPSLLVLSISGFQACARCRLPCEARPMIPGEVHPYPKTADPN
ncbi:hypothetical protein RvY_16792 [Ramazzottius varieornatus]|uniref:Uncharacterized protein n=1 Tax=Ramazzottius varieornatus TaxID=947166 RepID=A0A1D1W405_RAMVA|nr:hypothetical protein RvY_16792 [Ramazzottius varieornatus]